MAEEKKAEQPMERTYTLGEIRELGNSFIEAGKTLQEAGHVKQVGEMNYRAQCLHQAAALLEADSRNG